MKLLSLFSFDKKFIKNLLILSLPLIGQNLITSSLNFLDNIMIGHLGETSIAAVGLANQYYLMFFLTTSAVCVGGSVLISQFWGKKEIFNIKKFAGIGLILSLLSSVFFTSIALIFPEFIIGLFDKNKDVMSTGSAYLRAVAPSYIFTCLSFNFCATLRSTGQTSIPMKGSLIGFLFNGVLNYIFIFGKFGIEPLGVVGAALGTTFARLIEFLYLTYMVYFKNNIVKANFQELFDFDKYDVKLFIKTALPVVVNDFIWVSGTTAYSKAYAVLGTDAITTMQVANITNNLFYIFGVGLGVASSIVIGNSIGEGDSIESVYEKGLKMGSFSFLVGVVMGVLFFFTAPFTNVYFNVSPSIKQDILSVLRIMAFVLPFKFLGMSYIIGAFRGGGDVLYATVTEFIAMWFIAIPMGFASIFLFDVNISILYILICLEEFGKIIIAYPRFLSRKWIKALV